MSKITDELTDITVTTRNGSEIKLYSCEAEECGRCEGSGSFRDGDGFWEPEYISCDDCDGQGAIPSFSAEEIIIKRIKFIAAPQIEIAQKRLGVHRWAYGELCQPSDADAAWLALGEILDKKDGE